MRRYDTALGAVTYIDKGSDLDQVRALLHAADTIAADTETTGLDPYAPGFECRLIIVGSTEQAFVMPLDTAREITGEMFQREVWFHNRTYDLLVLEETVGTSFDMSAVSSRDTGILSRVLDSRPKHMGGTGHSLDDLGKALLGVDDKGEAKKALMAAGRKLKLRKQADVWRHIPLDCPEYITYAGQDAILTARLAVELQRMVRERGLADVIELEHRTAANLAQLTRTGMAFDLAWAEKAKAEYLAELDEAERELRDWWGVTSNGAWAHKAIPALVACFRAQGVSVWPAFTPTGREQLTQAVLAEFSQSDNSRVAALAQTVRTAQEARHFAGYVDGFLESVGRDGRVHAVVNPLAAVTGRMSVSNPPLQQLPRSDARLRGCFVPDEGHVLVSADYAQMEIRAGAAVTADQSLIEAIVNGEDIYERIAVILGGPDWTKDHRQLAKGGVLAFMYASGVRTMVKQLGVSEQRVMEVRAAVDGAYPGLRRFLKRATKHVEAGNTTAKSFTGRPLVIDPDRPYTVLNVLCQGPCRDVMAQAVNSMFDAGIGRYLRLVVHDEAILSVPAGEVAALIPVIEECMYADFRGVPMTAEAEILGERWRKA